MFYQLLALIGLVMIGGFLEFWMRRFEMQGVGIWLSFGLILTYAFGPLWGFLFAISILIISFVLFPYEIQGLFIMGITLAGTLFAATFFDITAKNFLLNSMMIVIGYNIVSNIIWMFMGSNWFRLVKFAMLSILFNYLIFSKLGWAILMWVKGG
ncbi:MAG: hypothetical protein ABIG20_04115 [archaeon]